MREKANIIALKRQLDKMLEEERFDYDELLVLSMKLDEEIVLYMKEELNRL